MSLRVPVLAVGLTTALAVLAAGWGWERVWLGSDNDAALAAVQFETRQIAARMTTVVQAVAREVARQGASTVVSSDDEQAVRRLFETLDAAVAGHGDAATAVTVHDATGIQLAWTGRPDDLDRPVDRVGSTLLAYPGPTGLLLVAVEPLVDDSVSPARRLGTVVAERALARRLDVGPSDRREYRLRTSRVEVVVSAPDGDTSVAPGERDFVVPGPDRTPLFHARVVDADLEAVREGIRRAARAAALAVLALVVLWHAPLLLAAHGRATTVNAYLAAIGRLVAVVAGARLLLEPLAQVLSSAVAPHALGPPGWSPSSLIAGAIPFLLTSLALLALVAAVADAAERWKLHVRSTRRPILPIGCASIAFALAQLAAGAAALGIALLVQRLLRSEATRPVFELLGPLLVRWNHERVVSAVALLLLHAAAFWGLVVVFRCGRVRWRLPGPGLRPIALLIGLWLVPLAAASLSARPVGVGQPWAEIALVVAAAAVAAALVGRATTRLRRASAGLRLLTALGALVLPSVLLYPSIVRVVEDRDRFLVETQLASQVRTQREEIQVRMRRAQEQIDQRAGLEQEVVAAAGAARGSRPSIDLAYALWSRTDLATHRLASAVEVYGPDELLFSRFALNLPEYTRDGQRWREGSCAWTPFEEVSPLGSEERQLQHSGRNLCVVEDGITRVVGTIVVHVLPDFNALPFITSQSPYVELFRGTGFSAPSDVPSRDVELVVYGWSRMPIYASTAGAWPLDQALFSRIYASRTPFWTQAVRGGRAYHVYLQNDRAGIYALGYPAIGAGGHLTSLAELIGLAAATGLGLLVLLAALRRFSGGGSSARALLREFRTSFYRKLFLAFVLASVVPVLTLASFARAYIASRFRADVELAAARTTSIAQRFIDEVGAAGLFADAGPMAVTSYDDDVLVWVSRVLDQDVNIFDGPRLVATSKRDLFASGLLSVRTPADVYRAVVLERRASFIGTEQAGRFQYLLAAAPVGAGERRAVLTVPLTSRQREIEREIAELDRRIVVAALLFVVIGAVIGYKMAERIGDPVSRLTRAARRIARGDLDARTALTSADELGRLVEAFNNMAADLQRQRTQLERTNRLEAWAEMARQVAHEIKNPLTPIQLSAEHLRRVHTDRGRPLAPILDDCTETILTQVRLLRQIAGEFSSFASSPIPRPVVTSPADLIEEVIAPYRPGLPSRLALDVDLPSDLPRVVVDRTLVGRALTNVIDNALHAMPGGGTLRVGAAADARWVQVVVADSGVGMDDEALRRVFEPSFSTKATGTGLGLAIARRNVELSGGTIGLESRRHVGTTVTVRLPVDPRQAGTDLQESSER